MTWRLRREQLGRHRICRPWACGTLRRVRVFLDQYQCRLAARVAAANTDFLRIIFLRGDRSDSDSSSP